MRISVGREKNGSRAAEQSPKKKGESNGKTFDSAIETLLKRNWMMNQQQTNFVFSSRASMTIAIKNLIYGSFDSDLLLFFFWSMRLFCRRQMQPSKFVGISMSDNHKMHFEFMDHPKSISTIYMWMANKSFYRHQTICFYEAQTWDDFFRSSDDRLVKTECET